MATTLNEISQFLKNRDIKHVFNEDDRDIFIRCATDNYRDSDGDKDIMVVIKLYENGEYVKIFVPNCYKYPPDGPNATAVFQACLMISWMTKSIQFEYDVKDGEIRCIIEFPLEDALLTEKQLMRCIRTVVQVIDEYDDMMVTAMSTGEINPPEREDPDQLFQAFMEFMKARKQQSRARSASSAGIDLEE